MTALRRAAGGGLLLSAALLLAAFVALYREDAGGAFALLVLGSVVTVPALVAAVVVVVPALDLLRDRDPAPRTPVCALLLALGHLVVAVVASRPGADRELDTAEVVGGLLGGAGLLVSLLAVAVTGPGARTPRALAQRLLLAVSAALLVLAGVGASVLSATQ